VCWDRPLCGCNESVYSAWFPLAGRWLGFADAAVTIDAIERPFSVQLLVPGPVVATHPLQGFCGRWTVSGPILLAAITLRSDD